MSSKIDQEMLKSPDVFISTSDKVFNFIEHHSKTFLTAFALFVAAGVGYVGVTYIGNVREQKASEALYVSEAVLQKAQMDVHEPSKIKKLDPKAKPEPVKEDYSKNYAPAVEQVKSAIKAHSDTRAALVSALNLSYFLLQQKQFGPALEVLQLAQYKPGHGDLLAGFWFMHRGVTLLENNQIDPAIESYQTVLHSEALKPFHPEALLKLGVCYEVKGDLTKARETYDKLSREFRETEAAQNAQQYLRLLELKTTPRKS